jgi:hypothetical protein
MMDIRLAIELILCNVILMIIVYHNVKRKKILLKYALIWFLASIIMIFCALTPNLMHTLASFLGIETVSNMIFLFTIGINLIITFILTTIVSNQKNKITGLVEEIGIIKEQLKKDK